VSRVLGLDIGGSRSRARLVADDVIIGEAEASSASLTAAGPHGADRALAALLQQLPVAAGPLDAVCAGAAGLRAPETRDFLRARLAPLTSSGTVIVVSDAELILPAAGLADGIAVICGTGSIAMGEYQGRNGRAGGWGYLLGDEGSGYWIVRAALRTLLDRRDRAQPGGTASGGTQPGGTQPGTGLPRLGRPDGGQASGDLASSLLAAAGAADLDALHAAFLREPQPRHWARYAPAVLACQDPAVAELAREAAAALAAIAGRVATRIGAPADLPVVLAGGLMAEPRLRAATSAALTAAMPGCDVRPLTEPPVAGAVRLAAAAVPARA
jgi:glucosamine kinase